MGYDSVSVIDSRDGKELQSRAVAGDRAALCVRLRIIEIKRGLQIHSGHERIIRFEIGDHARVCRSGGLCPHEIHLSQEREVMHIAILRAYLDVQFHAMIITGLQTAECMEFARAN